MPHSSVTAEAKRLSAIIIADGKLKKYVLLLIELFKGQKYGELAAVAHRTLKSNVLVLLVTNSYVDEALSEICFLFCEELKKEYDWAEDCEYLEDLIDCLFMASTAHNCPDNLPNWFHEITGYFMNWDR